MKNRILSEGAVKLTVVALLTLLLAGCAVAPKTENLSVGATSTHWRTDGSAIGDADDLQSYPSDSPKFIPWVAGYGD